MTPVDTNRRTYAIASLLWALIAIAFFALAWAVVPDFGDARPGSVLRALAMIACGAWSAYRAYREYRKGSDL